MISLWCALVEGRFVIVYVYFRNFGSRIAYRAIHRKKSRIYCGERKKIIKKNEVFTD